MEFKIFTFITIVILCILIGYFIYILGKKLQFLRFQEVFFKEFKWKALFVGNNLNQRTSKGCAERDAEDLRNLLSRRKYVKKSTLKFNSSTEELQNQVSKLSRNLGEDEKAMIYFSSHGELRDGIPYVKTRDGELSIGWVVKQFTEPPVLIMDQCLTGGNQIKKMKCVFYLACNAGETSATQSETEGKGKHSKFTGKLLEIMKSHKCHSLKEAFDLVKKSFQKEKQKGEEEDDLRKRQEFNSDIFNYYNPYSLFNPLHSGQSISKTIVQTPTFCPILDG